ncbi:hypothetical protein [Sphingomonas profundi]|uniref:hypothetical protein n=1 Tax=Alterirhizorhabdus profundi TaxID=2681549 RepID=UPI0018D0437C|nr:hypothetical protein [Sphingomonas profundi]
MAYRSYRLIAATAALSLGTSFSAQASAYLFWRPPVFAGAPVKGDEPGLGLPMPKATAKEYQAHLLWNMRAGLNVAALQCQFAPALMTVRNYNDLLRQHSAELNGAYSAITAYFKRTGGKGWQTALDEYTTKTYNGFSTLYAQLGFCETAGSIGRDALERRKGDLYLTAQERMREFRNSLVPAGDGLYPLRPARLTMQLNLPSLDEKCWDKRNQLRKRCGGDA